MLSRWLLVAASLVLTAARPYEDTKQRFQVDVPDAWKMAPRFGDLAGMTFERSLESMGLREAASVTVHVDPVSAPDLSALIRRVEDEAGPAQLLSDARATVGGLQARLREHRRGSRLIRGYFLEVQGRFFHLRFEAPEEVARTLEPELDSFLRSFKPGSGAGPRPGFQAPEAVAPKPAGRALGARRIVGKWRGPTGARLVLEADGAYQLGDRAGTYQASASQLILEPPGKDPIPLSWTLAEDGQVLIVSGDSLKEPVRYRLERDASSDPATLAGAWRAEHAGGLELSLEASGRFKMGPLEGSWKSREGRLVLAGRRGESVSYRMSLDGDVLELAGGDLERPLTFRRGRAR